MAFVVDKVSFDRCFWRLSRGIGSGDVESGV